MICIGALNDALKKRVCIVLPDTAKQEQQSLGIAFAFRLFWLNKVPPIYSPVAKLYNSPINCLNCLIFPKSVRQKFGCLSS